MTGSPHRTSPVGAGIVVVTDEDVVDGGFVRELVRDGWTVSRASAGPAADAAVARAPTPGAVILQAAPSALPDAVRRLRRLTPAVIVAVSPGAHADARLAALAAGADDVLDPATPAEELSVRLRVLIARRACGAGALVVGDVHVDLAARAATRGRRPLDLTPREFELLSYLAVNSGIAVSRHAIAQHIWSHGPGSDSGVTVLVFRLRRKLEVEGEPRVLHAVRGWGYVLRPPPAL
jgi:two-component system, OmpR family, response regulator PrrA